MELEEGAGAICTFCTRKRREVAGMIAGRSGAICNECVAYCIRMLETDSQTDLAGDAAGDDQNAVVLIDLMRDGAGPPGEEVWSSLAPRITAGLSVSLVRKLPYGEAMNLLLFFFEKRSRGEAP